ncbi:unnamed protein product [Symbiodinium necroappetens]|uniref:HECT-type E3 ubiquitin transferase n=1 Tax=Symbiodinium necroappetens TaxID=1628268 RepID=A0A812MSC8_9DINO|nr:unnamed protein product [Symbiodinium necroappetens]
MPWFRVDLSTTLSALWLCRKVGCWAKSLGRLGALILRFVRRAHLSRRPPDYGHLLMTPLYPGNHPSPQAASESQDLVEKARSAENSEDALLLLGEAVLLNPPDASLHLARAHAHHACSRYVEALDDAETCISLDSKCSEGWLAKGKAELALGRAADAAASFQAGLVHEPNHPELSRQLSVVQAEPAPNILQQFKELVFAARLGLENLFRTLEDPQRATDAFVDSNAEMLDAQLALLAQTLRVNTSVLFDSPRLCDAYEQIVHACAQLVSGAPKSFSRKLSNARKIVEGLSLALRIGWQIHHGLAKHAASALIVLATCPEAEDGLRRMAVRGLLGGLLRWLVDARPEPEREVDEVCGCSCAVPWKAAACYVERLLEIGRPMALIQFECETWPDTVQLCQWLTLSVRDYHATPLGLVALLQMPGVAAAAMKTQARVDFFIAPHLFPEELGEDEDEMFDEAEDEAMEETPEETWEAARANNVPWWRAAQMSRQPMRAWRQQMRFAAAVVAAEGQDPSLPSQPSGDAVASASASSFSRPGADISRILGNDPNLASILNAASSSGAPGLFRWIADPAPPPPQRLGEWLMNSLGYLFLFIEGDALFTVYACRALKALAKADPDGDGQSRLLGGLWLGVPLLGKLSLAACTNTAALDLLHCLFEAKCPAARAGIRCAARSLAHALASDALPNELDDDVHMASSRASSDMQDISEEVPDFADGPVPQADDGGFAQDFAGHEDDLVPSWAEFHHELFQELACPIVDSVHAPELVTLANFESKASLLAEQATLHSLEAETEAREDSFAAVPAAWNRNVLAENSAEAQETAKPSAGSDVYGSPPGWQTVSAQRLRLFHELDGFPVGSAEYLQDSRMKDKAVLMSRRSIRTSQKVHNWAQAVSSAEQAGACAVIVFNDLDAMEPFRMGLFGEKLPSIPAFMISGKDGAILGTKSRDSEVLIVRSVLTSATSPSPPPWPLAGGRVADIAQAWSLLEALSAHGEPTDDLEKLLQRMSVPEKRVWLTRRLVRHHRAQQATSADGDLAELPLAFVESDRWLSAEKQLEALRQQFTEKTGIGSVDVCGEFEVRFRSEQGVGSAVVREWMDLVARDVYLQPRLRLLRSYDQRQTFWPDAAAPFLNRAWQMDFEILGSLIGLALWQNCTLDLPLHPHVCALLFGFPNDRLTATLADMDEELFRHKVQWLLVNPINQLGIDLAFSDPLGAEEAEGENGAGSREKPAVDGPAALPALVFPKQRLAGDDRTCEVQPFPKVGSAEVALSEDAQVVTEENKEAFVELLQDWRLQNGIKPQVQAIAKGLSKVLPEELRQEMHSLLTPVEIAQLLSGLGGALSVDDWEQHTSYTHGLSKSSDVVTWFWQVVRAWAASEEDLLPQLLQFVTGSARVPVGGFSELVGFNGAKHAFTLCGANHLSKQALPVAHTCICTLDMPFYEDFETCRYKMTQMLRLGRAHFDEGAGQPEGAE